LVRGKVTYMAPEQADGKAFAASDVFSLGVILFELLTGARFYGDLEQLAVFKRLLADEQPFAGPRAVNPSVPESLDVLVRKMLERDPARRFTDGLELASALSEWQRSTGTGAGEAELRELMHGLFSGRIRDTHDFLASVRAGLIPEVSTPSGPGTMPGVTQSLVKPRPPPAPPAPPQTRAPEPPTKSPRLVPRLALGGLLLTALIGAALAGRSSSSRSEAAPSPPAPAAAATVLMGVDAGPPTLTDATPVLDAGLTPHVDEPGPPPASAPSARSKPMRLSLDTEPWTRVFLGRRLLGQTPLMDVSLPAGTHVLRLVNEGLSIDTTVEIEGRPGERVVKRLSF
jgi:serine/threonine-protein kinase